MTVSVLNSKEFMSALSSEILNWLNQSVDDFNYAETAF